MVELVVVILIISVLAVSVGPSLTSPSSGISAVTDRDQLISLFRTVQTRAMQNTEVTDCHGIIFSSTNIGMAAQNNDDSCNYSSFLTTSNTQNGYLNLEPETTFTVLNSSNASVSSISFDDYGRPIPQDRYVITFDGLESVCIESQGYIHVCS